MNRFRNLYGRAWRKLRAIVLAENPLCAMCAETGRLVPAEVVDHITPHKGDLKLFWDRSNMQSLCKRCHDSRKQSAEKLEEIQLCDVDGYPTDFEW